MQTKSLKWVIWIVFFMIPMISSVVCHAFSCQEIDVGSDSEALVYMSIDAGISCDTPRHNGIITYAALMVLAVSLERNRRASERVRAVTTIVTTLLPLPSVPDWDPCRLRAPPLDAPT